MFKKKVKISLLILLILGTVTGCKIKNDNPSSLKFKKEYEALNQQEKNGQPYRELTISKDNPFVYITIEDLMKKIEKKETFYVYFGSPYCPWCRSVIEKAIDVMKDKKIKTIYYINIWDGDHQEIIRDTYQINENGEKELIQKGDENYPKLLEAFDKVLSEYTLKDKDGNTISIGEKRIFAPNFIYVEKGKGKRLVDGISSLQKSSNDPLTKEILKEEEQMFTSFFK